MSSTNSYTGWPPARIGGVACASLAVAAGCAGTTPAPELQNARRPGSDAELRAWLENMVAYHRFTTAEVTAATGMSAGAIGSALDRFGIRAGEHPRRGPDDPLLVLPYPGGRHPRIGFLEGALKPQRESKFSVFAPWDDSSHVVVDVPEAIWSNLGLTYLAHQHVPTIWTRQGVELEPLEWSRRGGGGLSIERTLPNGITFGAEITPRADAVLMELWIRNETAQTLSDLRAQNCVLLKGADGFAQQTDDNKVSAAPYVACRSASGDRWIISAWVPLHRTWTNRACPCMHSDPAFLDCAPGEVVRALGWLSFFVGDDIEAELRRIDATGWRRGA